MLDAATLFARGAGIWLVENWYTSFLIPISIWIGRKFKRILRESSKDTDRTLTDALRTFFKSAIHPITFRLARYLKGTKIGGELRYRVLLRNELERAAARESPLKSAGQVSLRDVYVPLRIEWNRDTTAHSDFVGHSTRRQNRPEIWDCLSYVERQRQASDRQSRTPIIITGSAGSGKTTLLRHAAIQLASGCSPSKWYDRMIPALVSLPKLGQVLYEWQSLTIGQSAPLSWVLQKCLIKLDWFQPFKEEYQIDSQWFEKIANQELLLLLDALDEVPTDGDDTSRASDGITPSVSRKDVVNWIDSVVAQNFRCQIVITSRIAGFVPTGHDALVASVLDFIPEDIEEFISNAYLTRWRALRLSETTSKPIRFQAVRYFLEHLRRPQKTKATQSRFEAHKAIPLNGKMLLVEVKKRAEAMFAQVGTQDGLKELAANPLTLGMLTELHQSGILMPENRSVLYERLCTHFLKKASHLFYEDDDEATTQSSLEDCVRMLQAVAWILVDDKRESGLTQSEIIALFSGDIHDSKAGIVTFKIIQLSCILIPKDEEKYWKFSHRTFGEYYAGTKLLIESSRVLEQTGSMKDAGNNMTPAEHRLQLFFRDRSNDARWHEALCLCAAAAPSSNNIAPIAEALADSAISLGASLDSAAILCARLSLEADVKLSDERQRALRSIVHAALDRITDNNEQSKLFLTLATYELKHFFRGFSELGNQERDAHLVTNAVFRLFMHSQLTEAEPKFFRPLHWDCDRQPEGTACSPVYGVDFESAIQFTKWLCTQQTKFTYHSYRLPTSREAARLSQSTNETLWTSGRTLNHPSKKHGQSQFAEWLAGVLNPHPPSFSTYIKARIRIERLIALLIGSSLLVLTVGAIWWLVSFCSSFFSIDSELLDFRAWILIIIVAAFSIVAFGSGSREFLGLIGWFAGSFFRVLRAFRVSGQSHRIARMAFVGDLVDKLALDNLCSVLRQNDLIALASHREHAIECAAALVASSILQFDEVQCNHVIRELGREHNLFKHFDVLKIIGLLRVGSKHAEWVNSICKVLNLDPQKGTVDAHSIGAKEHYSLVDTLLLDLNRIVLEHETRSFSIQRIDWRSFLKAVLELSRANALGWGKLLGVSPPSALISWLTLQLEIVRELDVRETNSELVNEAIGVLQSPHAY